MVSSRANMSQDPTVSLYLKFLDFAPLPKPAPKLNGFFLAHPSFSEIHPVSFLHNPANKPTDHPTNQRANQQTGVKTTPLWRRQKFQQVPQISIVLYSCDGRQWRPAIM